LSSKESISDQAPGRKVDFGRRETAANQRQESGFPHRTPSHDEISGCPCSGNPYNSTDPHHFRLVLNRVKTLTRMTETRILVLIPARMAATRLPGKPLWILPACR